MGLSPYLELLRAFLLLQFEAELLGPRLQLADLLRGLRQSLLQLVELALLLLPQAFLDALLLLAEELPEEVKLRTDLVLQVVCLLLGARGGGGGSVRRVQQLC